MGRVDAQIDDTKAYPVKRYMWNANITEIHDDTIPENRRISLAGIKPQVDDTVSFSKTITEMDVDPLAGIADDFYELHMNKKYAEFAPMGKQIVHGVIAIGLASNSQQGGSV